MSAAAAGPVSNDPWAKALVIIGKNDCFTCHNPDHKVIGPAFRDVAKRYLGKPGIVAVLVEKVKAGGAGNWGQVPMVAHPNISDADLTTVVEGILSLAKGPHAMAPGMKKVMELVHSGAPIHCPAMADGEPINGPAYLADREPIQPEVSRLGSSKMVALDAVDQETK